MKPSSRHAHERDTQSLVSHIERGARRALGVARREWRGALATLVIVAFLWQTFASSGVAFAISETAGDVAHTVMVNADGAGDTTAPAVGTETPGDGQQPSTPSEPTEPAGSSDDSEPGTPDTTTVPTGTESDSATTQQGGSTLTSQNTTPATEAEEGAPEGEPTGTVTPADDESTDEPRAVEAWDWTGRALNLELSSPDGLAIDEEEVRAHVAEQLAALAADDEAAATDAEGTATDEGTEPADDPTPTEVVLTEDEVRALLPAELPATLDLAAELDPAANAETGDHSVIMPGDRFTVNLPEGIVLASTEAFDIYQLDANGNETGIRIATAEPAADGTALTVTFVAATDAAGTGYTIGAPTEGTVPAEEAAATEALATAKIRLALDVTVATALMTMDGAQIAWTLQTATDGGADQTATLTLPALGTFAAAMGIEGEIKASAPVETEEPVEEETTEEPAEEGALELGMNALTAMGDIMLLDGSVPADEYRLSGYNKSDLITTQWADNNSTSRPSTDTIKGNSKLYFTLDGTQHEFTLANAQTYLGMDETAYNDLLAHLTVEATGVNTVTIAATGLPGTLSVTTYAPRLDDEGFQMTDTDGNLLWDATTTDHQITWNVSHDAESTDYSRYFHGNSTAGSQIFQLESDKYFNIIMKVGDEDPGTLIGATDARVWLEMFVDNQPYGTSYSLADLYAMSAENRAQIGIEISSEDWDEHNQLVITLTSPQYTPDGKPIEYRIRYERDQTQTTDYYEATYDNTAVPNLGSDVTAAYGGTSQETAGSMIMTHVGVTDFTASKAWLDGGNTEGRGPVSFSLWRYTQNGSAATASQVRDAEGNFVTLTLDPASPDYEDYLNGDGTVNLGKLLDAQYPNLRLDKYDSDGYPYAYGVREDTQLTNYETVYGSVSADGTVADTAPNYTNRDGQNTPLTVSYTRTSTDRLTYNGGTVSNRLTGQTTVTATKTWAMDAFADQVKGITCEFTLQEWVADDSEAGGHWADVLGDDGNAVTQDLDGFNAEQLTLDISGRFDRYDEEGEEIRYRWVESGVTQDGYTADDVDFQRNEDGSASFTLHLHTTEGDGDSVEAVRFTSTIDETGETPVITNTFYNTVDEYVDKTWQQADGEFYHEQVDFPDKASACTVNVYRGTTLVGTFVLDGTVDTEPQDGFVAEGFEGATVLETSAYYLEIEGLPLYDETGGRYVYRIVEEEPEGWNSTRVYDAETHTTYIENSYGPGEATDFHLTKEWVDGDDAAHRLTSLVSVTANTDIYNRAGDLVIPKGTLLFGEDAEGNPVGGGYLELSEANGWFHEFTVAGSNTIDWRDLTIEEVMLRDEVTGEEYPVVADRDEALAAYGDGAAYWANQGWDDDYPQNQTCPRVATENHVYEVTTSGKDNGEEGTMGKQLLTVENRRIGLVDLTVEKEWKDEGAAATSRPDALLELTVDDPGATFVEYQGRIYIHLTDGNYLPVYKSRGGTSTNKEQYTTADATVSADGKTLSVPVSTQADGTYYFSGLPKYTGAGDVVHYTVNEVWAPGTDAGDYRISVSAGDYNVGDLHFHDNQTWTATNRRQGTTEAHFHKEWNDYYVNEGSAQQRPDIYLTLYRVTSENGYKPEQVDGYVNWLWQADEIDESNPGSSNLVASQYAQTCSISNLPKYDANGFEIIYYATEQMSSNGASLGYADVTFSADGVTDDGFAKLVNVKGTGTAQDTDTTGTAIYDENIGNVAGSDYAVRSGGTFHNALTGTVVANGTKLWEDVPGIVDGDDLPEVLIIIQRRPVRAAGQEVAWPSVHLQHNTDGTWTPVAGEETADGANSAIAWTQELESVGGNAYSFTIDHKGLNTSDSTDTGEALERYNEAGELYEYRAVEVIVGLIGTDALEGTDWNDPEKVEQIDLSDVYTNLENNVYIVQHGETGSFMLRNVYQPTDGSLTVKKLFSGERVDGDVYPDVTYTLYRTFTHENGDTSDPELVATHTVTGEQFTAAASGTGDTGGLAYTADAGFAYTFEGLDIYAPDGEYWHYYVVESSIDGYTTTVGLGDLSLGSGDLKTGETVELADGSEGMRSDDLMDGDETLVAEATETAGDDGTTTKTYDQTVDVTFANSYHRDTLELTGTKRWEDYGGYYGPRPDSVILTLSRYTENIAEHTVQLNYVNDEAPAYLEWTQIDSATDQHDTWTYTISNLEQWAPDGNTWTYKVTERLPDGTVSYRVITGTGEGQGTQPVDGQDGNYTGVISDLVNGLDGSVTVTKVWQEDEGNQWNLRPVSIEVTLQARYQVVGSTDWSAWADADVAFGASGMNRPLPNTQQPIKTQTLSAANNWTYTWESVPTVVTNDEGKSYNVQYRVVESSMTQTEGSQAVNVDIAENGDTTQSNGNCEITYDKTLSYNGVGVTEQTENVLGPGQGNEIESATTITNTLESTQLSIKKVWDDESNMWGLRDEVQNSDGSTYWTVTYRLQQRVGDNEWVYATDVNGNQIEATVRSAMVGTDGNVIDEATATFTGLPMYDAAGKPYEYRAVEVVPDAYDVKNPLNENLGDGMATVAGSSATQVAEGEPQQTFVNSTELIGFSGTKTWEDYDTGLAPVDDDGDGKPDAGETPALTLQSTTKDPATAAETDWEDVLYEYGEDATHAPEATWTIEGVTWTWSYSSLPRLDENGNQLYYRAVETDGDGSVAGYYAVSDGTTTGAGDADGNQFAPDPIENVATRFTIDKIGDNDEPIVQNGVTLELAIMQSGRVYGVWQKAPDGTVTSWVWPGGAVQSDVWPNGAGNGRADISGAIEMTDDNAGWFVGIPTGTYTVVETGAVPDGYARMDDVTFTISASRASYEDDQNGTQLTLGAGEEGSVSGDRLTLTVEDPIFRGYFNFTKRLGGASGAGISGATFDLYRQEGDEPDLTQDTLMVKGITTGSNGTYDSKTGIGTGQEYINGGDDEHKRTGDGLLPGTYYLMETSTSNSAYLPSGEDAVFTFQITETGHNQTVTVRDNAEQNPATSLINEQFGAEVTLHKYDADDPDQGGISGATFRLEYQAPTGGSWSQVGTTYTTETNGNLTIPETALNRKGTYRLTETANPGYEVDGQNPLTITFTLGNEDHGKTFDLTDADARAALGMTDDSVKNGTLDQNGVANTRLSGSVTLTKRDAATRDELHGAEFKLQWQDADGTWQDTPLTGLTTGTSYTVAGDMPEDLAVNTQQSLGDTSGVLTLKNLPWGTYRFVETKAAPGYEHENNTGLVTTQAFTVGRLANGTAQLDVNLGNVVNTQTGLTLRKVDEAGGALTGATFRVTPVGGSAFADGTTAPKDFATGDVEFVNITGELVDGGTYRIEEVAAPAGYACAQGGITVTMHHDGTVTVDGTADNDPLFQLEDSQVTITATNRPVTVMLQKNGDDGSQNLAGARFVVEPADGTTFADGTTENDRYTTTGAGPLEIEQLLVGGTYTIREDIYPEGYEDMTAELAFAVGDHGEIIPQGDYDESVYGIAFDGRTGVVTITVTDPATRVRLLKTDAAGTPLAGAVFEIKPAGSSTWAGGGREVRSYTSGADGLITLEAEVATGGTYQVTEVTAPEGFELAGTVEFTVAADGTVEIAGAAGGALAPTDGSGTYTATHDDGTGIALITVADTPAELTVVKAAGADGGKVYLAGAEFTLTEVLPQGASGEPQVIAGTTGDDGSVVLTGLKAGSRYELAETVAPEGYELLTETLVVDVAADGTVTVVGETPDGFTVGAARDSVEVLDRVLGVSLVKTDEGGQALAGAEFTLEPMEGTFPDGSAVKTFTSDEFGAVFCDLQLAGSPEGRAYVLTETVPPVGYRAMDPVTILVYEDGTVALDGETPEALATLVQIGNAGETPVVSVSDELVQVDLTKVSTGGGALAGAEFRIAGTFADGTAERTVTVGEDGTAALEGLVAGETYTLTETVAPESYELIEGDFAFTVVLDGTVSGEATSAAGLLGQRSAGYYVADDGLAVIAVDEPTPLLDRLTSTGDLLPMAGYLLASGALLIVAGELRRRRKAR
ncbi:SpaA isopeptide-forming pilin-related protein [Enorma burkinafasonensis]|uniref:SpaA isopeptide-forming pilin-related protein n=1 Tax=Enorma burkinafasonensis TaxID=2590867 RepID=UPI0026ECAFF7|nr:SpaA isopeptide-forming pilin-related protein [Enorma burkinafasonensis]MCI7730785.1 Cna B-type domain-containing protein [Enorma burkinafasonensis]